MGWAGQSLSETAENHRISDWLGQGGISGNHLDLWRSFSPMSPAKVGHLVAQDNFQITFGYPQGWKFHNFPGQPVQCKVPSPCHWQGEIQSGNTRCAQVQLWLHSIPWGFNPMAAVQVRLALCHASACGCSNLRNTKSQAQLQDQTLPTSTSLPKATSCGVWVSIGTKVMGVSGNNTGIKMWQQGTPRAPSDRGVQKFRTLITMTMCDPAFVGYLVAEVPLKQGLVPVPAALAALAAGRE